MTVLGKPQPRIVKVMRVLGSEYPKAIAYARGGTHKQAMFLGPVHDRALGDRIYAYFEAELVMGKWWLGQRLPDSPNRNW